MPTGHRDPNVLLTGSYAPATAKKYFGAVIRFAHWCRALGLQQLRKPRDIDRHLSDYMVELWFDGVGKAEASCTFYGLDMLVPGIKKKMERARRSLRGYNRMMPSVARPPMPWTVAAAVAVWLAAQKKATMAIGVILSFECYLRSGELLRLITTDFASGGDARLGLKDNQRMHIHLRRTKTGRHQGVEVRDQQVMQLVQWLLARTKAGRRVFNYHASTYRRWFHRACAALSLSPDYVPHSLRHGGATRDYLNGVPIADVMVRGRWAATKSATHYIQQGRQLMMLQSVPSYVDAFGKLATNHLYQTILFSIASQSTNVSTGTTHTS
jgi:integrase